MGAFSNLSALYPHPPEQQDYVSQYAHLAQLRQMMGMAPLQRQQAQQNIQAGQLDIQQKQQALNDQQAATSAMQEWDGQNFMELPSLVLKHGGSAQAVFGLKNQILQQQTEMTKLSTDQLNNQKQVNDYIAGHIANVQALPPEQQADGFKSAVQDLVDKKYVTPQQAQGLQYQGPQQLDYLKKTYQGLTAMQEEALKKSQAAEAEGKGAEAQAIANEKNQQGEFFKKMGLPAGITPDMAGYAAYIQKGGKPEGYPAFKAQQEAAATQPYKIQTAEAEAKTKQLMEGLTVPGYAFDPKTGQTVLTDQTSYLQSGGQLQAFRKVGEKDVRDDTMMLNRLGDVHQKIAEYEKALQQPLLRYDQERIASVIGSDKLKIGAFGTEIPADKANAFLKQINLEGLSPAARDQVVAYYNAREAMMGYKTVLSGSARGSDKSMDLLTQALPDPSITDRDYSRRSLDAFKQNLHIVGQGLPILPGIKSPQQIEQEVWGNQGAPKQATTAPGPGTAKFHYQGKKGEIFSNDGQTWYDASGKQIGK
jgi:hypothetical protein